MQWSLVSSVTALDLQAQAAVEFSNPTHADLSTERLVTLDDVPPAALAPELVDWLTRIRGDARYTRIRPWGRDVVTHRLPLLWWKEDGPELCVPAAAAAGWNKKDDAIPIGVAGPAIPVHELAHEAVAVAGTAYRDLCHALVAAAATLPPRVHTPPTRTRRVRLPGRP